MQCVSKCVHLCNCSDNRVTIGRHALTNFNGSDGDKAVFQDVCFVDDVQQHRPEFCRMGNHVAVDEAGVGFDQFALELLQVRFRAVQVGFIFLLCRAAGMQAVLQKGLRVRHAVQGRLDCRCLVFPAEDVQKRALVFGRHVLVDFGNVQEDVVNRAERLFVIF